MWRGKKPPCSSLLTAEVKTNSSGWEEKEMLEALVHDSGQALAPAPPTLPLSGVWTHSPPFPILPVCKGGEHIGST